MVVMMVVVVILFFFIRRILLLHLTSRIATATDTVVGSGSVAIDIRRCI